jgi:predicted dinucleotide-binding enzyme
VDEIGREGGDVSDAEAVLLAVPGGAVAEALAGVGGLDGKTVIDATNLIGVEPPSGFASNAEYVKSVTGGPTAKSFNVWFASLVERLGETSLTPSNLWCGDAGYEPVCAGPLSNASLQEGFVPLAFAIVREGGVGPFFYRMAPPERF